jgi:mono/diheme cytochrome c family protein
MSQAAATPCGSRREGRGQAFAKGLTMLLIFSSLSLDAAMAQSPGGGNYTKAQAAAGQDVFNKTCAICHGDHLQGGAGPALAGDQFLSVSQFQKISAEYFYHFMATHMPLTNPGSLTKKQYISIMAYLLEVNGYPAGSQELTDQKGQLEAIKIEPQH